MEELNYYLHLAVLFSLAVVLHTLFHKISNKNHKKPPPSPPSLPIINHFYMLKKPLHQTLHKIATKYSKIILLKLGTRKTLLISSPSAVEECLVKNNKAFADRPDIIVARLCQYNRTTMSFSPYNESFPTLKRVMTQEVFSSTQIPLLSGVRQEEVRLLLRGLWLNASNGHPLKLFRTNLNKGFNELALNIMTTVVAGKRTVGLGMVARNSLGEIVAMGVKRVEACLAVEMAEAMAARWGLKIFKELGHQDVLLESDAQTLVCLLAANCSPLSPIGLLVDDILNLSNSFLFFKCNHVRKAGN